MLADFKFNGSLFNEPTFDHWIVVAAELVPLDPVCLTGPFTWEIQLEGPFTNAIEMEAPFNWQKELVAEFNC